MSGWGTAAAVGGSLLGGAMSDSSNRGIARANRAMQREFAQKGIQWRVADARKAGINPIYALGANTSTPVGQPMTGSAKGDAIAEAGQAISRHAENRAQEAHEVNLQKMKADAAKSLAETQLAASQAKRVDQATQNDKIMTSVTGSKLDTTGLTPAEDYENMFGGIVGEYEGLKNRAYLWWRDQVYPSVELYKKEQKAQTRKKRRDDLKKYGRSMPKLNFQN